MTFNKKTIFILIAIFFGFLIAFLPASVSMSLMPENKNFAVSGVSGTLWSGQASRIKVSNQTLDNIRWQLSPFSLLTGSLGLNLQVKDKAMPTRGDVTLGLGNSVSADNLKTRFDAALLEPIINVRGVNLSGTIALDIEEIAISQQVSEEKKTAEIMIDDATLEVAWDKANVSSKMGAASLGSLIIKLRKVEDGKLEIKVREIDDVTGMNATFLLSRDGKLKATGEMNADLPKNLQLLGGMLGKPQGDKIVINYDSIAPFVIPQHIKF